MGTILQLISHLLRFITLKIERIMATLEEVSAKADLLQQTLDQVQDKVAAGTAQLVNTINELKAQIATGSTDTAALQAIADKLDASISDLNTTVIPSVPQ